MFSRKDRGRKSSGVNEYSEPGQFTIFGKPVLCPHCSGSEFRISEAQLNTAFASLINLDWADKSAAILVCTACSRIKWFEEKPSRVS